MKLEVASLEAAAASREAKAELNVYIMLASSLSSECTRVNEAFLGTTV